MDVWHASLLAFGLVSLVSVRADNRAVWCLVGLGLCFTVTDGYRGPYPEFICGFSDLSLAVCILSSSTYKWETYFCFVLAASVLVSALRLVGLPGSHYAYVVSLEVVNYLLMCLLTFYTGQGVHWDDDRRDTGSDSHSSLTRALSAIRAQGHEVWR